MNIHDRIAIRDRTAHEMTCHEPGCGKRMLITSSGALVCETGHGKLRQPTVNRNVLRKAYPERIIKRYTEQEINDLLGVGK